MVAHSFPFQDMDGKKGKQVSSGLTPATKAWKINNQGSPDDSNKENIPPSSRTRSSSRINGRALFNDEEPAASSRAASSTRRDRSAAHQSPGRKRGSSPASNTRREEATPTKKSPSRPRRTAALMANVHTSNYYDQETPEQRRTATATRKNSRKAVLELDNVDVDAIERPPIATSKRAAATAAAAAIKGPHFSSKNAWRGRTPEGESDEEEEEREEFGLRYDEKQQATPSIRKSTRHASVGRNEGELERSPIERKLTNLAVRTPSKGREDKAKSPARTIATRSTPSRTTVPSGAAVEVSSTNGFTPIRAIKIKIKLPKADMKMVVKKEGDAWRKRTFDTPRTAGRPPPRRATIAREDRDASYHPESKCAESDEDDREESEESSESGSEGEEMEEEEEEEEEKRTRPRTANRGRKVPAAAGRSCSRPAAKVARPAKGKVVRGFRLQEDDEVKIDLRKAPASLAAALDRLALYRSPRGTLLCREAECAQIKEFIKSAISPNGISQACYISGVPGTGKTASVMAMMKELAPVVSHPFVFIQVNSMYFADPKQVFAEIYYDYLKQTAGDEEKVRRLAGTTARKRLNEMFERVDRSRPPVLMLIDELDQLATKKQELIYDIFNWTSVEDARVSIISIANTLDLPERMLNQRICSRLGMNRIVFQPYSHEEIERIIASKLGGSKASKEESVIEADAVQLAARKVAAISGDLRKATDILRTAIEKAIVRGEERLTMIQVNESIRAASSTLLVHAVCALATHQMIVFEAAVDIVRTRDVEDFSMFELTEKYEAIARLAHDKTPLKDDALFRFVLQLTASALISFTNPNEKFRFRRRMRLVPAMHDAVSAIKIATDKKRSRQE